MTLTAVQRDLITRTVLGEASGEGPDGMAAVANVIKNRAASGQFPSDPGEVATQHSSNGIYQFSAWNPASLQGNNLVNTPSSSPKYQAAAAIVDEVFDGSYGDNTGGATFYKVADTAATWAPSMFEVEQIGHHVFYTPSPPVDLARASEYGAVTSQDRIARRELAARRAQVTEQVRREPRV